LPVFCPHAPAIPAKPPHGTTTSSQVSLQPESFTRFPCGVCDLHKLGRLAKICANSTTRSALVRPYQRLTRWRCQETLRSFRQWGPDESHSSTDSSSLPVLRFNCRFCRKSARGQFLGWVRRSLVWAELRLRPYLRLRPDLCGQDVCRNGKWGSDDCNDLAVHCKAFSSFNPSRRHGLDPTFITNLKTVFTLAKNHGLKVALSRCQIDHATNLLARQAHAAATTSRHVSMADALKARCVLAEVKWRWTLKVFCVAACTERNLCADPMLLKPCILCSRRRVG